MKRSLGVFLGSTVLGAMMASPMLRLRRDLTGRIPDVSDLAASNAQGHRLDRSKFPTSGPVEIVVQLSDPPLAVANGEDSHRFGGVMNRGQQIAHSRLVREQQDEVLSKILALGGTEIGRVRIAYNAAIVRVDASKLSAVAALPGVVSGGSSGRVQARIERNRSLHRGLGGAGRRARWVPRQGCRARLGRRLHAQESRRPRHGGGLPGGLWSGPDRPREHDTGWTVPHGQDRRGLRLRR